MSTPHPKSKPSRSPEIENPGNQSILRGTRPVSLREMMAWDAQWRDLLLRVLLPVDLLRQHGVDPVSMTDADGNPVAHVSMGQAEGSLRFELYHAGDAQDALLELELADTSFNTIEVTWLAIQKPHAPRFDIDRMPDGQVTMRGILRRNVAAEEAAMAAGLTPGQVRIGIGSFTQLAGRLETFMCCLNQREYIARPLFYHSAVLFERIGFAYIQGQARMESIDTGFVPGGRLRVRLDGSSPFRRPDMADTVRGRAWAIHAGILDQPWEGVRMVKRLGVDAGVDTCPDLPW